MACCLALLLLVPVGCSSEGGIVGSGISSVQGNVIDVQLEIESDSATDGIGSGGAEDDLSQVLVSIDDTDLETLTDIDGYFSLDGSFSGAVTVRFRNPADDESLGTFAVNIAPGATLFLRDVEIRRDLYPENAVIVREPLQLNLSGTITGVDCGEGLIVLRDDAARRSSFDLRLFDATELVDPNDEPLACTSLTAGEQVVLEEGIVDVADGSIDVVRLVADAAGPPPQRTEFQIRRQGVLLRVECGRGRALHLLDTDLRDVVRVELTETTRLVCPNQVACACEGLHFGQVVDVRGVRTVAQPGLLVAGEVRVSANPGEFVRGVLTGDIGTIDCARENATIVVPQLADPRLGERITDLPPLEVQLLPDTLYLCGDSTSGTGKCECEDVGRRYRVRLDGLIPTGGGPIRALAVEVIATPSRAVGAVVRALNCGAGRMTIEDSSGTRWLVEISSTTRIHRGGSPLSCSELAIGEQLKVEGKVIRSPDFVQPLIVAADIQAQGPMTMPGASGP